MNLADLSPARRAWLATCLYDSRIEKHEGPWDWGVSPCSTMRCTCGEASQGRPSPFSCRGGPEMMGPERGASPRERA